jgi:integrase
MNSPGCDGLASCQSHPITLAPESPDMTDSRWMPYSLVVKWPTKQRRTQPLSSPSSTERVVRKRLADGTVKEYLYPRKRPDKAARIAPGTLQEMLVSYRLSPEFAALKPRSRAHYNHYLFHLEMAWEKPLAAIKRKLLLEMRDRVAVAYGPAAANDFIKVSSAVFAWGRDRGWLEYSPIDRVKRIPTGHFPAWSMAQVAVALERFPEALRRAVVLGLYTGQRRGDLVGMQWGAYNGTVLRVRQEKTKAELIIPVHSALRAELEQWKQDRSSTLILTSPRGLPWSGTHLSTSFAQAVRGAGLPAKLNVHGLRKLAAANLAEAGCSASEIAAITGHQSLAMVQLYTASAQQAHLARSAVARLETGRSETA